MQFPLTPHRDEAAALAFDDVASGLDAGLTPVMLGGNADHGERVLQDLLGRRRVELRPIEDQVLAAAWRAGRAGQVLRALARQRRQRAEMARNLIGRLCYPLAVLAMAIVAAAITGSLMVVIVLAVALCSAIAAR